MTAPDVGLFGPGSMTWDVCRERAIALMIPRVLLLQAAHPTFAAAADGYAARGGNRFDRAVTTLTEVVFGDRATARAHARRLDAMHRALGGIHPDGRAWSGVDPEPTAWVLVTLIDGALRGAELARGRLSDADVASLLWEARRLGELFGVPPAAIPATRGALDDRVQTEVRDTLRVTPALRDVWTTIVERLGPRRRAPVAGWVAAIVPPKIAAGLALPPPSRRWRLAGRAVGAAVGWLPPSLRFVALYRERSRTLDAAPGPH